MTYDSMTRFKDALQGRPKDHAPVWPMMAGWVAVNFASAPLSELSEKPDLVAQAQIEAYRELGWDVLFSYADPLYIPEAFGCRTRVLDTGPLVDSLDAAPETIEDIETLPWPDPRGAGRLPSILEITRSLTEYSQNTIPVVGLFEGPFTSATRIVEAELIMRMILKRPAVLEALLDRMTDFLIGFGQALIENGAHAILMPEPSASASMISPKMFNTFVLPRIDRICRALAVPVVLHICGKTTLLLESMNASSAAVLSLDQCMDLAEARRLASGAVLGGLVDPVQSLMLGDTDKVTEDTRNCLKTAGLDRFILMSGCGAPPASPMENLRAMVQAAKEYGLGD